MSKIIAKKEIFSSPGYIVTQTRPELGWEPPGKFHGRAITRLHVVDHAEQVHVFLVDDTTWMKDTEFLEMDNQRVRVTVTLEVLDNKDE
jgi:hypothetical protein